jgi:ferredoxin
MTTFRITVDPTLCSGFGTCSELAPELFELDRSGIASVRVGHSDDPAVHNVAAACPMGAITIVSEEAA